MEVLFWLWALAVAASGDDASETSVPYTIYDLCRHPRSYQSPTSHFDSADVHRCPLTPSDVETEQTRPRRATPITAQSIVDRIREKAMVGKDSYGPAPTGQ